MPIGLVMFKQLYVDISGIDRRFVNLFWDIDLTMRVYANGGDVYILDEVIMYEADRVGGHPDRKISGLSNTGQSKRDLTLAFKLWAKGRRKSWVPQKKRMDAVQPF